MSTDLEETPELTKVVRLKDADVIGLQMIKEWMVRKIPHGIELYSADVVRFCIRFTVGELASRIQRRQRAKRSERKVQDKTPSPQE